MNEREAYERLKADSYTADYAGFSQRQSDIEVLWQARAALQSSPGQELARHQPCGCILCVCEDEKQCQGCGAKHCGTHPLGAIPNPVYDPPTATVEAATIELARRCLWLAYVWNDHNFDAAHIEARREAQKHGINSVEEAQAWLERLASQPAQQAEDGGLYTAHAKAVESLNADYRRSTTPQAEAQAGETRAIKPDWKAMYESQVEATLEQARQKDEALSQLRAANERAESERRMADHARGRVMELAKEIDALRAQLAAQPQAVEEAAKVDTYALQLLEAAKCPDCAGCVGGVMVEPGVFEQNECEWCFRRWQALEPLRALRNKADAQEENDG